MTTISWKTAVGGDWTTGVAWAGNIAPTTGDDAIIDAAGSYTVTIAAAEAVTVHSATLNDAGATLAVKGTLTLAGTTPSLDVQAGEVLLGGTIAGGTVQLGANALSASGSAKVASAFDAAGGVISIATGATLTLANGGSLDTLEQFNGPGTLATAGAVTVGSGGIALDGSLIWNNAGTVSSAAQIDTDYPSGGGTVTINNLAGAAFDLTADDTAFYIGSSTTLNNAGTLAKTAGTGSSTVTTVLNNTGTLGATAGTLELDGGGTFGATNTITGAGVVEVNGGVFTLAATTATVAGALALTGGAVQIDAGKTLTLSGANAWGSGTQINGPGTLATTGATTFTSNPQLDDSLVWNNSGTVSDGAQLDTDYPSGGGAMTINNLASGAFRITADGNAIYVGSATTFNNAGVLSKTGGTGTSNFTDAVVNTGTLTATSGTLELDGGASLGGKIGATGTGQLVFGGGSFTVAGAAATVTGPLTITSGVVQLDTGKTLTLSGATTLVAGTQINGPGTLATTGATSFGGNPQLDGSLVWNNSGAVSAGGQVDTDYPSATGKVTINNLSGGVFDFTADQGIYVGAASTAFNNTGTLEKTAGAGVSPIFATVVNTGTLAASSGTLELDGGGTLGGTIVETGTGAVQFGGGAFAFQGAVAVTGKLTFDNGATLAVGAVSGTIATASVLESAVTIAAAKTLTLTGATTWGTGTQINGPGTLLTTGATTFATTPFMDGSLVWNNSGAVSAGAQLNTDYPSGGGTIAINNLAGAAFDLTVDGTAIYVGANTTLNNIGALAKTGGTGASMITPVLNNTGTLTAATGTLELDGGGTFGAKNTITGAGVVEVNGGVFTVAGTTATVTGALALTGGTVQIDAGKTLTLSGANAWGTGTQINGPGTLATTGATTFTATPFLDGSLVWNNSGTVSAGAQLNTDYPSGGGTMSINNLAGAAFDLTVDGTAVYVASATNFNNTGVLAKSAGSGITTFDALLNSNGTLTAKSGTLQLIGGGSFGAQTTITGAGAVAINAGTYTVAGTTATVAGTLGLTGGVVQVDAGKTLTLTGANAWGTGTQIDGPGTLLTTGATTFAASPNLDGSLVWNNGGVVTAAVQLDTDSPSNAGTVTIDNLLGGTFDLTADGPAINIGSGGGTKFINAGRLAKTGGTGTSTFAPAIVNTGSVTATTGTLELDGGGTLDGEVGGGIGTGVVLLANGASFVSTGNSGFVADAGVKSNLRIVNGATWTDNGFVEVEGHVQIGNGTGVSALVIAANDAFRFTADDGGIVNGTGGTLINNGQLGKTAGTGTSTIGMPFTNNGTVVATSGTLKLAGAVGGTGTFLINAADVLELASGAVAGGNTVDMNGLGGLGATLKLDTNSTVAKPIIGLGNGSRIDMAAAASVGAVINGNTLVITPAGGTALNFVSTGSLAGLVVTTAPDGGVGTLVSVIAAPPPIVTTNLTPSASNAVKATLGTAVTGFAADPISVALTSDADFAVTGAGASTLVLNNGTLIYTPGLVTQAVNGKNDTIQYTVTDTVTGAVTKETQPVSLSDGPPPIVTLAAAPAASNIASAKLGTAVTGHAADGLTASLTSDADFATGSKVVLTNGTLFYTPGLVTAALVGPDIIKYAVQDAVTGAVTTETQTVTLSASAPPVVTLATAPTAGNNTTAKLGTAAPGTGADALSVSLTADADFAITGTGASTLVLNNGTLVYTPGLVAAAKAGADSISYTVTDTVTGVVTKETQSVTLSNGPAPIVTLAATPSATNTTTAKLGTATPGHAADALSVTLTSDTDFTTGSKIVLNSGTLTYTPGVITAAKVGADTIKYTVTDTVTGAVTAETQTVTLVNAPGPIVTLAATPTATNTTSAILGTATPGVGTDALSVVLTSDADYATGSKLVLTNGNLVYTAGAITPAKAGSDSIAYTVTDTVTGAVTKETQTVTIIDSILTLTVAPTTVIAAQEINTFIAPAGALNSRDNLTGGPNTPNTLDLSGGGAFDLNAPKTLANIQIVNAAEGQAAFVSGATNIANTAQVVFLRDGLNVDLVVGAGTPNTANPNVRGITIYGGSDGSVVNFGTGSDTMVLGSVGERVIGGTGTGLVHATAALAGAQVTGAATGTTTLEISGGGTAALNVNDTHVTVKLDAATVLTLSKAAFVTALGSTGADSITAGAAGQTLTGGAGADTLTGFSGFGDTFSDTSAGLNGDVIKLFGGSDRIDLTDMAFGTLKPLAFAAGALTVSDGVHTAKINFTGTYGLANFHPATDTHTGTLLTFVP